MNAPAIAHRAPLRGASTFEPFRSAAAPLRRAGGVAGDVLLLGAVILSIPLVILAIGMPIALFVQLLLWIGRQF